MSLASCILEVTGELFFFRLLAGCACVGTGLFRAAFKITCNLTGHFRVKSVVRLSQEVAISGGFRELEQV